MGPPGQASTCQEAQKRKARGGDALGKSQASSAAAGEAVGEGGPCVACRFRCGWGTSWVHRSCWESRVQFVAAVPGYLLVTPDSPAEHSISHSDVNGSAAGGSLLRWNIGIFSCSPCCVNYPRAPHQMVCLT